MQKAAPALGRAGLIWRCSVAAPPNPARHAGGAAAPRRLLGADGVVSSLLLAPPRGLRRARRPEMPRGRRPAPPERRRARRPEMPRGRPAPPRGLRRARRPEMPRGRRPAPPGRRRARRPEMPRGRRPPPPRGLRRARRPEMPRGRRPAPPRGHRHGGCDGRGDWRCHGGGDRRHHGHAPSRPTELGCRAAVVERLASGR